MKRFAQNNYLSGVSLAEGEDDATLGGDLGPIL
jgi:hypothetical protein